MPADLVIDNSVVISWCFPDEKNSNAIKILKALNSKSAIVPMLWPFEAANVFLVGERKNRSTATDTAAWIRFLSALPIRVDNQSIGPLFQGLVNIARQHELTAYDAAYLELAMRRGIPLATLDRKMKTAAVQAGVDLYNP